ncbi:glycoside hydrolase domain-containing protein [Piscinibacter terrae]|uniref:DUF1906 domain-containing protein n=1 Tax=Piscinibacter terrae TaxID=2496871 RepID=A0A3N7IST2_9BURK|nr:glycoside hydrolase domain-containing protein [Albitalea terrae]RQP21902.1 DUF1906 domain-containing protein [Albitalea terrae]
MTYYAGVDTDIFPGDERLDWLKANTNLSWCAYYLAPAPSHADTSWMGRRPALCGQGWNLVPVYVGQQTTGPGSHEVDASHGQADGAQAASLAQAEQFPPRSAIFLDWEDGSSPQPGSLAYIGAWVQAVIEGGFQPGLYCSHARAAEMAAYAATLDPAPQLRIWVWRVSTSTPHVYAGDIRQLAPADPAESGYPSAVLWQFEQDCELSLPGSPCDGMEVDLSWSAAADPASAIDSAVQQRQ